MSEFLGPIGSAFSAARMALARLLHPLASQREREVRVLTDMKSALLEIKHGALRPRCRKAISLAYLYKDVIKSDHARSLIVGAHEHNRMSRLNCYRDDDAIDDVIKAIEEQLAAT